MKRILVAGATGYLGGFVAREFKSQGHFVRALARSPESNSLVQKKSYTTYDRIGEH